MCTRTRASDTIAEEQHVCVRKSARHNVPHEVIRFTSGKHTRFNRATLVTTENRNNASIRNM